MTGVGSTTDPYVVSASAGAFNASDTSTVDHTLTGSGTLADPYILTSTVKVSPTAVGNLITTLGDGLAVTCESVQDCVGQALDDGLIYDDAANQMRVRLSTDAGNQTIFGTDGGVYTAAGGGGGGLTSVATTDTNCIDFSGNGTVVQPLSAVPIIAPVAGNLLSCAAGGLRALLTVGACGLTGTGAVGSPLAVNTGAWPYPCSVDTFGGVVACDATGRLRSEPRGMASFFSFTEARAYADLAVPAGFDQPGDSFATATANPDTCRSALVVVEREADVDFILPATAGAAYGHSTDETYYTRNTGTTTINDAHVQTTKAFALGAMAAPGAAIPLTFDVTLGRGTGGATYNRIQVFIRALMISL
ncbi:hypothetical protein AB0F17_28830 [Nonomuraea sp. NPDC026600]|uniref:hypothetical protein n=1 Tax=Nonomuraea sp. NPDC026600 TaxID=3155363 RepID=UPI0033E555C5